MPSEKIIYDESYAEQIVVETSLSKCAGFNGARVIGIKNSTEFNEPSWEVATESQIEEVNFLVGKISGKIIQSTRQVFNTQCLLVEAPSQITIFCCKCINKNPLCAGDNDVTFKGTDTLKQIKEQLGGRIKDIPSPGECGKINEDLYRDICYGNTAFKDKNITLCEKIQQIPNKENCYMQVARAKNDKSICEKIQSYPSIKKVCENSIPN